MARQTDKLVWIVKTIERADRISFEDLNDKWVANESLSNGEDMLKRTFHKWCNSIEDTFGLKIRCETGGEYRYYIANPEALRKSNMENWLLSTYSICNSLADSKSVQDRILLEDIPSGREYLEPIIDAMKQNRYIHMAYCNYWRDEEIEHYVLPLCVKLFRQRWYFVGKAWSSGHIGIFCLDRIKDFRLSHHTGEYPKDFSPQEYFAGYFGVMTVEDVPMEKVRLKVSAYQAPYLRDLPLQKALQKEVESNEEYSIFELFIRPTYDFQQEILWNGEAMEVLAPEWLREEMKERIRKMGERYGNVK